MKQADNNPSANSLAPGVDEAALATAIAKSGYPLNIVVAARLRQDFHVQEEWAYVDSNSGDLRSLDLLAGRDLWDRAQKQPRVRPVLNLLVECKQAQLPLVFFLSEGRPFLYEFPYLS